MSVLSLGHRKSIDLGWLKSYCPYGQPSRFAADEKGHGGLRYMEGETCDLLARANALCTVSTMTVSALYPSMSVTDRFRAQAKGQSSVFDALVQSAEIVKRLDGLASAVDS